MLLGLCEESPWSASGELVGSSGASYCRGYQMASHFETRIDGVPLLIEVTESTRPLVRSGSEATGSRYEPEQVIAVVEGALSRARTAVVGIARELAQVVNSLGDTAPPDELAVEFGVSFNTEGNVLLAKAGAEATLHVTLKYSRHSENS